MKKRKIVDRILPLCLVGFLVLSLAACDKQTNEQNNAQPSTSVRPTPEPTPTPPPIPYTDVPEDAPYHDAVAWAYENGIASDGETFGPADACTRGQVITFLWRAMGSPEPQLTESPVTDIAPSNWFYKPVLWAYESGISTSSAFKPDDPCTNGEALTFLWRAEGRPMAAMHNSAIALAAPNQYFTRPVAWAETNGLLSAEVGFDPSANCLRADLMTYLYWAEEQWTSAEEVLALQAEYEQIISDAQLYEVSGSGLCYADYVDVDGDGTVELFTLDIGSGTVTATAYANINGHAGKYCENLFSFNVPHWLSLCTYDNQICLRNRMPFSSPSDVFYKFENGAFEVIESAEYPYGVEDPAILSEYDAIVEKYINPTELLGFSNNGVVIDNRGLLPSPEEYRAALAKQWEAERGQIYAAVLNGDFSAFAGTYAGGWAGDIVMDKDGVLTGGQVQVASQKPISVTITESGAIYCVVQLIEEPAEDGGIWRSSHRFYIYPVGVSDNGDPNNPDYRSDPAKVRIEYWWPSHGVDVAVYSKIS